MERPWKLLEGEAHWFSITHSGHVSDTADPTGTRPAHSTKAPAKLARDELRGECSVVTFRRGEITSGVVAGGASITAGTA